MKTKIRKGIFETNSSSIHTIAIHKETKKETPKEVFLSNDNDNYNGFAGKANYVYKLCVARDVINPVLYSHITESYIYRYIKLLESWDIKVTCDTEDDAIAEVEYDEGVANDFLTNPDKLHRFLFDDKSFIMIRDNDYRDMLPSQISHDEKDEFEILQIDV